MLVSVVAAGLGLFTLHVLDVDAGFAVPGQTDGDRALLVGAGWAIALAAVAVSGLVPRWPEALLLLGIAGAWFGQQWLVPAAPDLAFSAGLVLGGAVPAVVAHLALHMVRMRRSWVLVIPGYLLAVGLLGVAPALFYDPEALGCSPCAHNLLLAHPDAGVSAELSNLGLTALCLWLAATVAGLLWWLARVGIARRRETTVVVLIAVTLLLTSLSWCWHSRGSGSLTNDPFAQGLWRDQAWLLVALACAATLEALRSYTGRRALTRVVRELSHGGDVGPALGARVGDASVVVAFPVEDGYVDRTGRPVDPAAGGRQVTVVRHGAVPLAAIGHRRGLDPRRVVETVESISLKLDNERLRATAMAQLEDVRRSGRLLLETGDAERRRLERDLHDGAQQSLVVLLLQLRMAGLEGAGIRDAERHLSDSVERLRLIAHGLHPLLLDRVGLGIALEALAETRSLSVEHTPGRRFASVVESTAYQLVERCSAQAPTTVRIEDQGAELVIDVEVDGETGELTTVLDRIATLDGRGTVTPGRPLRVSAILPA